MTAVAVLVGALLTGCGGSPSPEHVVRAWSKAFNSGDNDGAAGLFAAGVRVIAGDSIRVLRNRDHAIAFNAGLPCSGRIVKLKAAGAEVTATFDLRIERPTGVAASASADPSSSASGTARSCSSTRSAPDLGDSRTPAAATDG